MPSSLIRSLILNLRRRSTEWEGDWHETPATTGEAILVGGAGGGAYSCCGCSSSAAPSPPPSRPEEGLRTEMVGLEQSTATRGRGSPRIRPRSSCMPLGQDADICGRSIGGLGDPLKTPPCPTLFGPPAPSMEYESNTLAAGICRETDSLALMISSRF